MEEDWAQSLGPEVQYVRLLWCDATGIRRCRVIPRANLPAVQRHGLGLAYACNWLPAWGDSCTDDPAAAPIGDMRMMPDGSAVHVLPWMPHHATALVTMCRQPPSEACECCPRTALARALAWCETAAGMTLRLGYELEFYLLHKPPPAAPGTAAAATLPPPIDHSNYCLSSAFDVAAPVLEELVSMLGALGIGVEQLHGESGPGQYELALGHAPAMQAADALLFAREALSAVPPRHGLLATCLPKLFEGCAASGMHVHFSLWRDGVNLLQHEPPTRDVQAEAVAASIAMMPPEAKAFAAKAVAASSSGGSGGGGDGRALPGLAPEGEAFMAGVLRHLPALMVFTTPSPNSYRRLAPHCWSGAYQVWGPSNKEAPLRLCSTPGAPAAANCELKTSDGTCNPHLAAAALAVAGMLGVQHGLRLPAALAVDPANLSAEQQAAAGIKRLPADLGEAIAAFEADAEFRVSLDLALGSATLSRAFLAVRRSEWAHFRGMPLEAEAAALYGRY